MCIEDSPQTFHVFPVGQSESRLVQHGPNTVAGRLVSISMPTSKAKRHPGDARVSLSEVMFGVDLENGCSQFFFPLAEIRSSSTSDVIINVRWYIARLDEFVDKIVKIDSFLSGFDVDEQVWHGMSTYRSEQSLDRQIFSVLSCTCI